MCHLYKFFMFILEKSEKKKLEKNGRMKDLINMKKMAGDEKRGAKENGENGKSRNWKKGYRNDVLRVKKTF